MDLERKEKEFAEAVGKYRDILEKKDNMENEILKAKVEYLNKKLLYEIERLDEEIKRVDEEIEKINKKVEAYGNIPQQK